MKDHCVFICYILRDLIICTYNIRVRLLSLSLSNYVISCSVYLLYTCTYPHMSPALAGYTPDGKLWALNEGGAPFRFNLDKAGPNP